MKEAEGHLRQFDERPVSRTNHLASQARPTVEVMLREAREKGSSVAARRLRWRHYETAAGNRPVLEFIRKLPDGDKAAILAAMKEVRVEGVRAARHLQGELYEVRADGRRVIYRVLFAREGGRGQ